MPEKDYQINLKLDRTDFKRNTEAAKSDIKEVEQASKQAAETQEQGAKRASRARVEGAKEAGRAEKQAFVESALASDGFVSSLRKVAVEQQVLGKVVEAGRAITSVMEAAAQRTSDLARDANKVRDSLREIAGLKGLATVTDQFMRENGAFLRSTGMTGQEGLTFRTAFTGAAALSAGVTIDKGKELDRFEQLSAQFAVMKKTDPAILADLAGASLRFKDYRGAGGGERAVSDVAGTFGILEQGAGDTSVLAAQQKKLASRFVNADEAKGAFQTPQEAAAAITIGAETSPDASAIIVEQALRAMRGLNDKQGGMLKAAGISFRDTFRTGMPKMFAAIDKAVAGGQTAEEFLSGAGINAEESRAVLAFSNKRDMFASQMAAADEAAQADPAATVGAINQSFANDKGIRGRLNASALETAKVERGMKTEAGELVKGEVEGRLFAADQIDTGATDLQDMIFGFMANPLSSDHKALGQQIRLNRAARAQLAEQGVNVPSPADQSLTSLPTLAEGWHVISGQADRDLTKGAEQAETNRLLREQNAMLRQQAGAPLPTVVPGGGNNAPAR